MTERLKTFSTRTIMLLVAACLLPGLILQAGLLSISGVLQNIVTALGTALLTEWLCGYLQRPGIHSASPDSNQPRTTNTQWLGMDPSALVTALILAAALPPGAIGPVAAATLVAIGLGKYAYGGLGNNVFNPAMVGYAVVLVSFPAMLSDWPDLSTSQPTDITADLATKANPDLIPDLPDGLSGATILTTFKYRGTSTVEDVWTESNGFGLIGGLGYEWIGLAFLLGGSVLFALRLAAWRPAAGMLITLCLLSLAGYDSGSSASLGSPTYHLFGGSTLLAACFVITDPVTHPAHRRGQWLFGIAVGAITFSIRSWGNYPDGLAFAILLGNALSPFLDRRFDLPKESAHG